MKAESEAKVTYGVWGLVVGAGVATLVGFTWGGWTTRGTAAAMTDAAMLNAKAAICVAQFAMPPNEKQRMKELKAVESWERAGFIEKGGWDKMPGEDKAGDTVARACADGLTVMLDK